MKNVIIAVLATISCLTAIGQSGQRPKHLDDYLYPYYMASGCYDTIDISLNGVLFYNNSPLYGESIIAQPFFIDSSISIKGIGAMIGSTTYTGTDTLVLPQILYLQIRDSSLNNVLAQLRYDTMNIKIYHFVNNPNSPTSGKYIEALFDNPITITDPLFYVTMTFLETQLYLTRVHISTMTNFYADCSRDEFPLLVGDNQGNWRPLIESVMNKPGNPRSIYKDTIFVPYEMLVFPILKRITSSLSEINVDNKVEVYPNPSSKEIYINSQYIINSIEILNSLGQRVYREKINSINKTIDISTLNKGIYIIELKTDKGVIHRKFIKE